jgi:hypothetical protein
LEDREDPGATPDEAARLRSPVDAYYLWPPAWVGEAPPGLVGDLDLAVFGDEAYATRLASGIVVRVLREGLFMFDFSAWPQGALPPREDHAFDVAAGAILARVRVMNAHLACLYSALSRREKVARDKMLVTPSERISMQSLDVMAGMGFGDQRIAHLATSRFRSTYSGPPTFDWRVMTRYTIAVETIADSFVALDALLEVQPEEGIALVDLILFSAKAFEDHNYPLSLVTSWVVTERLLAIEWRRYLAEYEIGNAKRGGVEGPLINRDRRERLLDTRTFTAAVIAETLSLLGRLDNESYERAVRVRKARNNWVHDLRPASRQEAAEALLLAQTMLDTTSGISLQIDAVSRLHF